MGCVSQAHIKYVPNKDHAFVGDIMSEEIKRLALLEKKPKEFAWLVEHVTNVMGHSHIVDDVIKDGIKKLIAENPDNFYMRKYLGNILCNR